MRLVETDFYKSGDLYHFTSIKPLIAIMQSDSLNVGKNGTVSFTFHPGQSLFRYSGAVLTFSPNLRSAFDLHRYEGDAASLAGGDEYELFAEAAVRPVSQYLRAIVIRSIVLADNERDFKTQYRLSKKDFRGLIEKWRQKGINVVVTDFNDTDQNWHQTLG
jgi:hypothetical protein